MTSKPTKAQRDLGRELRRLREGTGLSAARFGQPHGWSQSKVSKSERGGTLLSPSDVEKWARAAGADEDTTARIVDLATELAAESKDWSARRGSLADRNAYIGDVEAGSTSVHNFQPSAVSGLLQTADYARRVLMLIDPDNEHKTADAVARRLERQTLLYDVSKRFEFVLTEGALRWRPGPPALMRAQLDRVMSVATLPNVTIGILPQDRQAEMLQLNGFTIFDHGDRPFVLVETYHEDGRRDDEETVASYRRVFSRLLDEAIVGDEAMSLTRRLMDTLPATDRTLYEPRTDLVRGFFVSAISRDTD
ncbi:hypothetical protein BJF79_03375 [Actinomadura sp. CNU-125]|uniref:helix-turn-helix domain-containing protein n=1 Tax=Actinomadura sp. CNU-125 TaxID=1904961 RepID=UPI00095D5B9B|nr:helix-turn-helix transcriptional regulator [Actinomadura sp. CNU-125]OLT12954.1 hypothetical protein BJF79_03375 [Actinomadura sp. CNU-125]